MRKQQNPRRPGNARAGETPAGGLLKLVWFAWSFGLRTILKSKAQISKERQSDTSKNRSIGFEFKHDDRFRRQRGCEPAFGKPG